MVQPANLTFESVFNTIRRTFKKSYFLRRRSTFLSIMPKQYTCLQCDKTFKRKSYRLKHVINQHQFFQCEICKQNVKLGSRTVHVLRCKQREQMKTMRCLLCDKNFAFDTILYHLKHTHKVWEHIKMSPKPAARLPPPLVYEEISRCLKKSRRLCRS